MVAEGRDPLTLPLRSLCDLVVYYFVSVADDKARRNFEQEYDRAARTKVFATGGGIQPDGRPVWYESEEEAAAEAMDVLRSIGAAKVLADLRQGE